MNSTSRSDTFRPQKIPRYDLILIEAGPCGLAAASEFKHAGLNYLHLDPQFKFKNLKDIFLP